MKFTIETGVLAEALKIASVATMTGKSTLPILGNIKIKAKGEQVILSTTNLDIHVQQKLPAKVKKEGATTAPFLILSQLVARMQSSSISIEQQKGAIEFKSGEVIAELETLDAKEFPEPLQTVGDGVECDANDILEPFKMISHSISTETSRYALMGINVNEHGEFTATDGRRIALFSSVKITNESVIIPDVFIKAILRIEPKDSIKVFIGNGVIAIVSQEIDVCAKLIEAPFPSGPRTVMSGVKSEKAFSCGRKPLMHALQTCSIFSHAKNPGLNVAGKGKEVQVSQPGKALVSVLGTELAGQPDVSVKVNENFLLDTLAILSGDDVRIQMSENAGHLLIEEGKFKEVIMPMRVQ